MGPNRGGGNAAPPRCDILLKNNQCSFHVMWLRSNFSCSPVTPPSRTAQASVLSIYSVAAAVRVRPSVRPPISNALFMSFAHTRPGLKRAEERTDSKRPQQNTTVRARVLSSLLKRAWRKIQSLMPRPSTCLSKKNGMWAPSVALSSARVLFLLLRSILLPTSLKKSIISAACSALLFLRLLLAASPLRPRTMTRWPSWSPLCRRRRRSASIG